MIVKIREIIYKKRGERRISTLRKKNRDGKKSLGHGVGGRNRNEGRKNNGWKRRNRGT
jgi:hypothetical protein